MEPDPLGNEPQGQLPSPSEVLGDRRTTLEAHSTGAREQELDHCIERVEIGQGGGCTSRERR